MESLFNFVLIMTEDWRWEIAMVEKVSNPNSLQWNFNRTTDVVAVSISSFTN